MNHDPLSQTLAMSHPSDRDNVFTALVGLTALLILEEFH